MIEQMNGREREREKKIPNYGRMNDTNRNTFLAGVEAAVAHSLHSKQKTECRYMHNLILNFVYNLHKNVYKLLLRLLLLLYTHSQYKPLLLSGLKHTELELYIV